MLQPAGVAYGVERCAGKATGGAPLTVCVHLLNGSSSEKKLASWCTARALGGQQCGIEAAWLGHRWGCAWGPALPYAADEATAFYPADKGLPLLLSSMRLEADRECSLPPSSLQPHLCICGRTAHAGGQRVGGAASRGPAAQARGPGPRRGGPWGD